MRWAKGAKRRAHLNCSETRGRPCRVIPQQVGRNKRSALRRSSFGSITLLHTGMTQCAALIAPYGLCLAKMPIRRNFNSLHNLI
jgi:hypothetical protein